jgi:hypothetical protein
MELRHGNQIGRHVGHVKVHPWNHMQIHEKLLQVLRTPYRYVAFYLTRLCHRRTGTVDSVRSTDEEVADSDHGLFLFSQQLEIPANLRILPQSNIESIISCQSPRPPQIERLYAPVFSLKTLVNQPQHTAHLFQAVSLF